MLGQSPLMQVSSSTSDDRMFVYEVEGLRQSDRTAKNDYAIRNSSSVFIAVPRGRMNAEMRRITSLGGRIVDILPLEDSLPKPKAAPAQKNTPENQE